MGGVQAAFAQTPTESDAGTPPTVPPTTPTTAATPTTTVPPGPPDQTSRITAPSQRYVIGEPIVVSYTIANEGGNPTTNSPMEPRILIVRPQGSNTFVFADPLPSPWEMVTAVTPATTQFTLAYKGVLAPGQRSVEIPVTYTSTDTITGQIRQFNARAVNNSGGETFTTNNAAAPVQLSTNVG
jgi:hypothetical protein